MDSDNQSQFFDEYYYEHGCGRPYQRDEEWLQFFSAIAQKIAVEIQPQSVLDAGCAKGFLVENLRKRGVETYGIDISDYAISQVHESIRPYCWVGSIAQPFPRRYDLVVSIEVLEHMPFAEAERAIENICQHTDDVLFSSTPFDFKEITHWNVQPPEYWAERFALQGFYRDVDFDASFLTPWAVRFRRVKEPMHRLVRNYEKRFFVLTKENVDLRTLMNEMRDEISFRQQTLEGKDRVIEGQQAQINEILNSQSWRLIQKFQNIRLKLMPVNSRRERIAKRLVKGILNPKSFFRKGVAGQVQAAQDYPAWIAAHEPSAQEIETQRSLESQLAYRPLVSVVVPVYNTDPTFLEETVRSVLDQTYTHWEVCLVDGASTREGVRETLQRLAELDERIRVVFLEENLGISGNTNKAVEMAQGEFLAFLDHDDLLAPFSLYEVVSALNQNRELDLLYSDHDILSAQDGRRHSPLFKPGWSPEIMLSSNYITHLTVIRSQLVRDAGCFDEATDGAQDWDLFLRVVERTSRIAHIAKILYHWRDSAGSTATNIYAKPYAPERQLRAIEHHLERSGLKSPQAFFDRSGFIRVKWEYSREKLVSIIIPSRGASPMLEKCVNTLLSKTDYPRFEVLILNNGDRKPEEFPYYQKIQQDGRVRVLQYDRTPFNYSAINNYGAQQAKGDLLLFLNNDTEIIASDWLDEMVMWASHPQVGAVGAKLLLPGGGIQHAGIILGLSGFAGHVFGGGSEGVFTPFGLPEWYRDYLAVTAACLMMQKDRYQQAGGMNENFVLCGNDVELGIRLNQSGLRVVYTPYARLLHLESATHRGSIPVQDFHTSMPFYAPYLKSGDPYYNPNLSYWNTQPVLSKQGEPDPYAFALQHIAMLNKTS